MNSLQQQFINVLDKFYDESANLLQGKVTLDELIDQFMQNLRTWGLEVITQQLEQLDKDYKQLAIRKKRYAVKALRTCIKQTVYGQIAFKRTYYQDKSSGKYFYWLDEQLRLAKYSRMTLGFKAAVLINTGRHAYQEAIDMTKYNAIHSKATVMNIVHHEGKLIPNLVAEGKIKPRPNKVLYIEADEDHVAYQDSSNRFMKLVYVHEGYNTSAKRHFIKHAVYFTGNYLGSDNDLLWDEVWQYVKAMYPQVEKIYLAGDGAAWIKAGTAYFPHCKFVLDRFHLSKYCHLASTKVKQGTAEKLYAWALSGKHEKLKLYFSTRLSDPDLSKSARKQIKKTQTYILGNLEAIVRASEQDYQCCTAESHISHYLSERLSSRPKGWSLVGAQSVARVRIFQMNGGNVAKCLQEQADKSFKQERVSRVDKRIKLQRKGLKDNYYETWQSSFGESQKHHYFLEGLKHGGQKIDQSECII